MNFLLPFPSHSFLFFFVYRMRRIHVILKYLIYAILTKKACKILQTLLTKSIALHGEMRRRRKLCFLNQGISRSFDWKNMKCISGWIMLDSTERCLQIGFIKIILFIHHFSYFLECLQKGFYVWFNFFFTFLFYFAFLIIPCEV